MQYEDYNNRGNGAKKGMWSRLSKVEKDAAYYAITGFLLAAVTIASTVLLWRLPDIPKIDVFE